LTAEELKAAEEVILRMVQRESFSIESELLKRGKPIPSTSHIICLSPFLDDTGLIRMDGRTNRSPELNDNCKCPIILDPKHRVTRLLIQE
jgi:hypothetical protein